MSNRLLLITNEKREETLSLNHTTSKPVRLKFLKQHTIYFITSVILIETVSIAWYLLMKHYGLEANYAPHNTNPLGINMLIALTLLGLLWKEARTYETWFTEFIVALLTNTYTNMTTQDPIKALKIYPLHAVIVLGVWILFMNSHIKKNGIYTQNEVQNTKEDSTHTTPTHKQNT